MCVFFKVDKEIKNSCGKQLWKQLNTLLRVQFLLIKTALVFKSEDISESIDFANVMTQSKLRIRKSARIFEIL